MLPHFKTKPLPKLRSNPRLNARGVEVLDDEDLIIHYKFRPITLADQIKRLEEAGRIHRLDPGQVWDDLEEDEFGEELEDIGGEGITPHEIPFLEEYQSLMAKMKAANPLPAKEPEQPNSEEAPKPEKP